MVRVPNRVPPPYVCRATAFNGDDRIMLEILGFALGLLFEVVFAIVVRLPQWFFGMLTAIWNWGSRSKKQSE